MGRSPTTRPERAQNRVRHERDRDVGLSPLPAYRGVPWHWWSATAIIFAMKPLVDPKVDFAFKHDRWLYFLRHAAALGIDSLPAALDVPDVCLALGDLMMIPLSERERYESHLKLQRDMYTALAEKRDEGRAEGRAEGHVEGRAEGRAGAWRDDIRDLQEMLGRDVMPVEELQSLPLPSLKSFAPRLRRPRAFGLRFAAVAARRRGPFRPLVRRPAALRGRLRR